MNPMFFFCFVKQNFCRSLDGGTHCTSRLQGRNNMLFLYSLNLKTRMWIQSLKKNTKIKYATLISSSAAMLSGLQQPQFSHSGIPQEGQHSDQSPIRTVIIPLWSAMWETPPWLSVCVCITLFPTGNECQEPPLHYPFLGRISQPWSPLQKVLLHPCWLCVPQAAVSHQLLLSLQRFHGQGLPSPLSLCVTAGCSHSPEGLLVVVLRGWEAQWTRHSGSHEVFKPSV